MSLGRPMQVVVVDDHEVVRIGLRSLLDRERDINVVGTAETGERGLEVVEHLRPDVAVIDYNLPGMSGVELCAEIVNRWPDIRVVMLTTFLDDAVIRNSLDAGASAYVCKDVESRDLKRAIRQVSNGEAVLDPKVTGRVIGWARSHRYPAPLSKREVDVLRLVARGFSNREVGEELELSVNTVKTLLVRAMRKLGCHSRSQSVAVAAKRGLL